MRKKNLSHPNLCLLPRVCRLWKGIGIIMVSKKLIIKLPDGIVVEPAGQLADIAERHICKSYIIMGNNMINMRSFLNMVAIRMNRGDEITVMCEGVDENEALEAFATILE